MPYCAVFWEKHYLGKEEPMYVGRIEKLLTQYTAMPMCIINTHGKVTRASEKIADVFKYDGIVDYDIYQLTGIKLTEIMKSAEDETPLFIERNERSFKIICKFLGEPQEPAEEGDAGGAPVILTFVETTHYETLKELYNDEKVCLALINLDNFDELTSGADERRDMEVAVEIDRLIRAWAENMNAVTIRYRDNLYEIVMTQKNVRWLIEDRFSILDEARKIEADEDFPVTLSIGIGIGGKTLAEEDEYAQAALDMALGRGGDQAVIKNISKFEYYGGKTASAEKAFKGKARIIAFALKTLMMQSSKIFIMGHANPDMDCLGASVGIHRIAESTGKETHIVLGEYSEAMNDMVEDIKDASIYSLVSAERALAMADDNSLVVLCDVHRPALVESMELVNRVEKLVVIDHHRKAEDVLPNQTLSYMESYASSASEMVTEMLQYISDKKEVSRLEADVLLAGIMLDTNRFAVKAGVRTFEAASWLKRAGADLQNVRRYFQANAENFRARAEGIAEARLLDGGIAMSICRGENINSQIINAQVADELLSIKGIEASFVAGRNESGQTVVSARSLGNINVQVVMEQFGGGGHMNTAGARVDMTPEEILQKIETFLKTTQ